MRKRFMSENACEEAVWEHGMNHVLRVGKDVYRDWEGERRTTSRTETYLGMFLEAESMGYEILR